MRKSFVILFLLLTSKAIAPVNHTVIIAENSPVLLFDRLIRAVVEVESKGDTLAFNAVEQAYGPFQIRPIRLLDYNRRTGKGYRMQDCYRMRISREIFLYYAGREGPDYEIVARRWNGSGRKTDDYWNKVKKALVSIN